MTQGRTATRPAVGGSYGEHHGSNKSKERKSLRNVPQGNPGPFGEPGLAVWSQCTSMLNGALATKTSETSVVQSGHVHSPGFPWGASSVVNKATISRRDGSQPSISADVEEPGATDPSQTPVSSLPGKKQDCGQLRHRRTCTEGEMQSEISRICSKQTNKKSPVLLFLLIGKCLQRLGPQPQASPAITTVATLLCKKKKN